MALGLHLSIWFAPRMSMRHHTDVSFWQSGLGSHVAPFNDLLRLKRADG